MTGNESAGEVAPSELDDLEALMRNAQRASALLKALSHESRLLLMCVLSMKERSVGELEAMLGMRQSAVSQQLARLRFDGLVKTRRDCKTIHYSVANDDVCRVISVLHDIYCKDLTAA